MENDGGGGNRGSQDGRSQRFDGGMDANQGRSRRGEFQGRRLELPIFDGLDAYGWLSKVDRYFLINGVRDHEKVSAVLVVLEGEALNWFQWWEVHTENVTWENFRLELLNRFQPDVVDNPLRSLLTLRQTGTVTEFRKEFERVVSPLRYEDEELLRGVWLNGLCDSVREELLMYPTIRLSEMMKMALKIERRNQAWVTEGVKKPGTGLGSSVGTTSWVQSNKATQAGLGFSYNSRPDNAEGAKQHSNVQSIQKTNPIFQGTQGATVPRSVDSQASAAGGGESRRLTQAEL